MNAIMPATRWNPFKEMEELQNRLISTLGLNSLRQQGDKQEAMTVCEWVPLVDIMENDHEYIIKAELPEVNKDDVKVSVENAVLTITGERKFEKERNGLRYHRVECSYGTFIRRFVMPDDADETKVNAEFKDGLLKVHLSKNEKAKPRAIEVKVS